jgi:hypothetical protein
MNSEGYILGSTIFVRDLYDAHYHGRQLLPFLFELLSWKRGQRLICDHGWTFFLVISPFDTRALSREISALCFVCFLVNANRIYSEFLHDQAIHDSIYSDVM